MTRSILDEPEQQLERDALGRAVLARTIYDLVVSGLPGQPLRIGVYGQWGEGKTTVLKFLSTLAETDHVPVAWFNPWDTKDAPSLWAAFSRAVRQSLQTRRSRKEYVVGLLLRVPLIFKWGIDIAAARWPAIAALLPLQKALDSASASLARRRPALDKAGIHSYLTRLPINKRLIVIIDDLDRAAPEVVPHLLLALREIFDVPGCAFILALDPQVVAKAFPSVHPGWGTTGEFIEKIIQFPFWLPQPKSADVLRLALGTVSDLPLPVDQAAVRDLIDLLPKNPRRLKQYFRNILRLQPIIERHDPDEIQWSVLLLLELMRATSPLVAADLLRSASFRHGLGQAVLFPKATMTGTLRPDVYAKLDKEIASCFDRFAVSDPGVRQELSAIVHAFGDRAGQVVEAAIDYWADIFESTPILTWREFRRLLSDWHMDRTPTALRRLIQGHAGARGTDEVTVIRALLRTTIEHRQQFLDRAADVDLADQLDQFVLAAGDALHLIAVLAFDLGGFTAEPPALGLEEFGLLYEHVGRWAHFSNHKAYREARAAERELLFRIAGNARSLAPGAAAMLQIWMPPQGGAISQAGNELHREVVSILAHLLFQELRGRFARDNGVGSLWGRDRALAEKYLLFRVDSGFYSAETRKFLHEMTSRAFESRVVQDNFLQFLRLLAFGLTDTLGSVGHEQVLSLARDQEVVGLAWRAATARELQPRTVGSLVKTRAALAEAAGRDEHLRLPSWWSAVTEGAPEGAGQPPVDPLDHSGGG